MRKGYEETKLQEQCKGYEETKLWKAMLRYWKKQEEEEGEEICEANMCLNRQRVACVVGSLNIILH